MSVVLITGCSSGFGLACARAFARRGDAVVATLRDVARAPAELGDAANIEVVQLDVTSSDSIASAVRVVEARYDRLDVVVNNAGVGAVGALEVLDEQLLRDVFETNVFGAISVTRSFLPLMRRNRGGRVVFVNAIGGLLNTPYLGAYCASKHALDCIAATFAIELRPFGIRVSSVYPSAFGTAMSGNLKLDLGAEGSPYFDAASRYFAGLRGRIENGPTDLSPVVEAVLRGADDADPELRMLVAPHLTDVLGPLVSDLAALHQRELAAQ